MNNGCQLHLVSCSYKLTEEILVPAPVAEAAAEVVVLHLYSMRLSKESRPAICRRNIFVLLSPNLSYCLQKVCEQDVLER